MRKSYKLVSRIVDLSDRGQKLYALLNNRIFYIKDKNNKEMKKKDLADLIDKFLINNKL